jgi:DNA-binding MarR family transcriptional regulator
MVTLAPAPNPHPTDGNAGVEGQPGRQLDRLLALVERRALSALELRILLHLLDGELTVLQLAEALDRSPTDVVLATRRLSRGGFARRRSSGPTREPVFSSTPAGALAVRPLLTAASDPAGGFRRP